VDRSIHQASFGVRFWRFYPAKQAGIYIKMQTLDKGIAQYLRLIYSKDYIVVGSMNLGRSGKFE
jgi:hypothetical protein